MVVLTVVFNTVVRQHLQQQADDELRTRAAAVAATVDTRDQPVRVLETPDDAAPRHQRLDLRGHPAAGAPRRPPRPASTLTRAADRLARAGQALRRVTAGDPRRPCAEPVRPSPARQPEPAAVVVTAMDLAPYRSSADTLLSPPSPWTPPCWPAPTSLTRLAVGRALRPVSAR